MIELKILNFTLFSFGNVEINLFSWRKKKQAEEEAVQPLHVIPVVYVTAPDGTKIECRQDGAPPDGRPTYMEALEQVMRQHFTDTASPKKLSSSYETRVPELLAK